MRPTALDGFGIGMAFGTSRAPTSAPLVSPMQQTGSKSSTPLQRSPQHTKLGPAATGSPTSKTETETKSYDSTLRPPHHRAAGSQVEEPVEEPSSSRSTSLLTGSGLVLYGTSRATEGTRQRQGQGHEDSTSGKGIKTQPDAAMGSNTNTCANTATGKDATSHTKGASGSSTTEASAGISDRMIGPQPRHQVQVASRGASSYMASTIASTTPNLMANTTSITPKTTLQQQQQPRH